MVVQFIFWGIGLYILYKVIFDFILPIVRATSNVRKQFKSMQDQMNSQYAQQNGSTQSSNMFSSNEQTCHSKSVGEQEDYIDFEEIK